MNNRRDKNDGANKTTYIFTKETLGMTLLLFSAIVLLMLFTGKTVFAGIGKAVCTFMYGTFGYGSFLVVGALAYLGEWLVFEKKIKISLKTSLAVFLTVFSLFLLFHAVSSRNITLSSYGAYIGKCYTNAANGIKGYTFGGVISAIVVYPFAKFTTFIGAYVIFSILSLLCAYLIYYVARKDKISMRKKSVKTVVAAKEEVAASSNLRNSEKPIEEMYAESEYRPKVKAESVRQYEKPAQSDEDKFSQKNLGRKILFENGEFAAESYRRNMIFNESSYFNHPVKSENDYLNNFSDGKKKDAVPVEQDYTESYQNEVLNKPAATAPSSYVYGEKPVEQLEDYSEVSGDVYSVKQMEDTNEYEQSAPYEEEADFNSLAEQPVEPEEVEVAEQSDNYNLDEPAETYERPQIIEEPIEEEKSETVEPVSPKEEEREERPVSMYDLFGAGKMPENEHMIEPDTSRLTSRRERSRADLFDYDNDDEDEQVLKEIEEDLSEFTRTSSRRMETPKPLQQETNSADRRTVTASVNPAPAPEIKEEAKVEEKPKHVWKKYVRPSLDLLDNYPESSNVNTGEIEDNKQTIVETLARFKIGSEVSNVTIGPAITRYDVIIEDKTKIKQSLNYRESIAMALMKENVNAYLNYSKGALSIEVPNNARTVVGLKGMLASQKFINSKPNSLTFALGKNVEGEVVCPDITKMPHLLVAGTTGSGKSICLSALLISLLYKYGPEELRFILVDPKQVEFISYDKLPHLMINEIIYDVDKAIKALNWAIKEMERRYSLFKDMTEKGTATKNLDEYNAHLPEGEEKLPKIVIILDEFGDLMLQAKKDIEGRIIKLVQKARASGIHLILATQRPSVDCITGLIKSNLPTRIGFKVNSFDDARTIFDIGGAEKLLGKGDLYFRSAENPDLARIQGCFVDTHEVQRVTDFIKQNNESYFDQTVSDFINKVEAEENTASGGEDGANEPETKIDDTFIKALKYCVTSNQASVSMIQRRFPVGYIKACKIIDWMENMNYITHSEGSKPRKVIFTKEEFENTYGDIDD